MPSMSIWGKIIIGILIFWGLGQLVHLLPHALQELYFPLLLVVIAYLLHRKYHWKNILAAYDKIILDGLKAIAEIFKK